MGVFIKKPLEKRSIFDKLLKKDLPENMIIEVNNLFAGKPILEVTPDEINKIYMRYGAAVLARHQRGMLGYYHLYLQQCLEDKRLTEQEIAELAHLKILLGLSDRVIKQSHQSIVSRLYGAELARSLSDGSISYEEQQFLQELSDNLLLSHERTAAIMEDQAEKRISDLLEDIMSDERITPEEEATYEDLVRNLGLNPDMEEQTRNNFERYKLFWRLENKPLPQIETELDLEAGESACYTAEVKLYGSFNKDRNPVYNPLEDRQLRTREVFWRIGYPGEIGEEQEDWELHDSGKMILTNRRVIFLGEHTEKTIFLSEIIDFVPYSDGIRIEPEKGESIVMEMVRNADIISILLKRLLSE
jgi:hypothetical protein